MNSKSFISLLTAFLSLFAAISCGNSSGHRSGSSSAEPSTKSESDSKDSIRTSSTPQNPMLSAGLIGSEDKEADFRVEPEDEPRGVPFGEKEVSSDTPPTVAMMKTDLIGKSLDEGPVAKYFSSSWRYIIEKGDVLSLTPKEILVNTPTKFYINANVKLRGGKNYYYNADLKLMYNFEDGEWRLSIQNLGLDVVDDGTYNNVIDMYYDKNSYCMYFKNNSDESLRVGVKYWGNDRFNYKLLSFAPFETYYMYGDNASIMFIMRDN